MILVGKKKQFTDAKIFTDANLRKNKNKNKNKNKTNIHKFAYVSMYKLLHQWNGLFKNKNQGSHKWTRRGQQFGLNYNALSCVYPNFLSERDFLDFCTRCRN